MRSKKFTILNALLVLVIMFAFTEAVNSNIITITNNAFKIVNFLLLMFLLLFLRFELNTKTIIYKGVTFLNT